jgi:hypothetical protein
VRRPPIPIKSEWTRYRLLRRRIARNKPGSNAGDDFASKHAATTDRVREIHECNGMRVSRRYCVQCATVQFYVGGPSAPGRRKRRNAPPSAAIRRAVPVRTFDDWDNPAPGFVEVDLVAHSGTTVRGSYVQTLTLTDIATGWTECAPLLVREQKLLTEVLSEIRQRMPFALLEFDTDNNSVFMNDAVKTYCEDTVLVFTRCRIARQLG